MWGPESIPQQVRGSIRRSNVVAGLGRRRYALTGSVSCRVTPIDQLGRTSLAFLPSLFACHNPIVSLSLSLSPPTWHTLPSTGEIVILPHMF
jgi:hypothetical protein